ncbi:YcaO-like family protein [Methylobacterium oryzisoli]|uniref:YcaO-like family protein n=1 Tax=Methylobacterium oryzisoli TaxID=3385502 RepID=UPI0038911D9B
MALVPPPGPSAGTFSPDRPSADRRSAKQALTNGSRVVPPETTWERIRPHLPDLGVTRVGEITGLDRIGIPVWFAVRPNARTLSVSQGKGLTDAAARVSATMEAVELAHAEEPGLPVRHARLEEIAAAGEVVDVAALPAARHALFGARTAIPWTQARDWATGAPVFVPYELVHADATVPRMPGMGAFLHSTNGLASGNTLAEAVLHGLCECIERDAVALWWQAGAARQAATRLDLAPIAHPAVRDLLDRLRQAGVSPAVWEATSDVGVATVRAVLSDDAADAETRPMPGSGGAGCHPDRVVALCRALTEAAQSRLTAIAGARDDLGRTQYGETQSAQALGTVRALAGAAGSRPFAAVPTHEAGSVENDLAYVVGCLARAGLDRVLVVDLSRNGLPVRVARVIVPGLEGPVDSPSWVPGRRARAAGAAA